MRRMFDFSPVAQNPAVVAKPGQEFDLVLKDLKENVKPQALALDTSQSVARKIVQYLTDKHKLGGGVNTTAFVQGDEAERTKAISQHAFAVQRFASLVSLQHSLLTVSHNDVLKHIEDTINFRKNNPAISKAYPELYYMNTFVKPLQEEAEQLKKRINDTMKQLSKATQQFGETRHAAIKPLMQQVKQCNQEYATYFQTLQQSHLDQLAQALNDLTEKGTHSQKLGALASPSTPAATTPTPKTTPKPKQHVNHLTSLNDFRKLEYLEEVYQQARQAKPMLETALGEIKKRCLKKHNVVIKTEMGVLKAVERSLQKCVEEYSGDFSQLLDIARGSIVCQTIEDVVVVAKVLDEMARSSKPINNTNVHDGIWVEVVRVKNRLDVSFPAAAESGGYRDVLINVRVWSTPPVPQQHQTQIQIQASSSHICEMQIQLEGFLKFKRNSDRHKNYITAKSLHMLDPELGHVRVSAATEQQLSTMLDVDKSQSRVRRGVQGALDRVAGGSCRILHLDHVQLSERECTAIHYALNSPASVVSEVWLSNCGLDKRTSQRLCFGTGMTNDASTSQLQPIGQFQRVSFALNTKVSGACVGAFVSEELEELVLEGCAIKYEDIRTLCGIMTNRIPRNLMTLNLMNQDFGLEGMKLVAPVLRMMTRLTSLDLGLNYIGPTGGAMLADSLSSMTKMTDLRLYGNTLGAEGMRFIASSLVKMPNITTLHIYNNNIGADGAKEIAPSLAVMVNMQHLRLGGNNIGSEGARAIASSLAKMTNMQELGLFGNNIGAEGAKAIAPSLAKMTNIQELGIFGNNIGTDGATAIASSLAKMTNMQKLYLGDNNIGPEGAKAIASSLVAMTNMQTLNLFANNIGADGAKAIASSLAGMTNIQKLVLGGNNIRDDGATAIVTSLNTPRAIHTLGLEYNAIGSNGAQALVPSLTRLANLKLCSLAGNKIEEPVIGRIRQQLSFVTDLRL